MDGNSAASEPNVDRETASPAAAGSCDRSAKSRLSFRTRLVLFLTALLFCSWFFQVGHVNQISRYDAVNAFFENTGDDAHTFRIDRYLYSEGRQMNTSDWSEYGGHFYSNKSPGTTLFGVALLAPLYPLERRICPDRDGISPRAEIFNAWYLNFLLGVLPTAFSVLTLAWILLRLGASETRAVLGSFLIVLGTAVFPFSTTLMAHSTVAACLVFSLGAYLKGGRTWLAVSGACFGAAVLFDYSAGLLLPLALIGVIARERTRCWAFLAGGVPFAVAYCAYNAACFGGPFSFAAQYINPVYKTEGDAAGGLLALPNLWLTLELLVGARRGVFMASPFLLFAIPGFVCFWRRKGLHRGLAILFAASFLVLLLMNASFNGWHSGASFTARYIVPVFPLLGVLAVSVPLKSPALRRIFVLLAALSLLNMFAAAAYTVTPAEHDSSPVYGTCWSHLFDRAQPPVLMAQLGLQALRPDAAALRDASRFSIGSLLGLSYGASRLVCFLLELAAWAWFLTARFDSARENAPPWHERFSAWFAGVRSSLLARQAGAWTALACCAVAAVLLLPGDVPFTAGAEYPVQKLALDAVEARTFANPLATWGLPALCFQLLYLFTKNILVLAFLKTALSLAFCWWFLSGAAKRLRVSAPLLMLFATLTPYLMLAHKSLRGDSLLLPAGAAILYAYAAMYDRDETLPRRASRLTAALAVWSVLTFRMPAGYIGSRGPFAVLQMTFAGFAEVFHPALGEVDREAAVCLMLMAVVSVLLIAVLIVTGAVLAIRRRNSTGILSILILLPASLAFLIRWPYHPFFVLGAAPFAALLATFGAEWYLARRFARAAKTVLCVYFALCLCGWLVFLGVIHRDAGNRAETFGVSLSEQQAGAERINSELRRYAPGPIAISAKDDAERRMFFPVGWLAALDRIRDPYIQNPNAVLAPGFFIGYRDTTAKAQTGYLRILSRFREDAVRRKER